MKKILSFILTLCFVTVTLCGCNYREKPNDKLNIVTVIFPQYDFVRAIVGESANITMIMKPGAEIHGFEPSLSDIEAVANADVFIYNGGESDSWTEKIFASLDTDNIKIVNMMDCAELLEEETINGSKNHTHSHSHHNHSENHNECETRRGIDEHIWTSPKNAVRMTEAICDAVCDVDPENKTFYKNNAEKYIQKINSADKKLSDICKNSKMKTIFVGDRFPYLYLAKEYNLRYMATFSGCSPETDANPSVIINIIETMKSQNADTVFCTELSDRRMAKTIAEETNANILTLYSCQSISKQDFDAGMTYVDFMNINAENLKEALD